MILLIDNYDSFSYNLVQVIGKIIVENMSDEEIKIIRNDEISIDEIINLKPQSIIISPGPGKPKDAGICEELISKVFKDTKILGICLGHQAICETFGAKVTYAKEVMHGRKSIVSLDTSNKLFNGLTNKTAAARYHSLAVEEKSIPKELKVIAKVDDEVMAVCHKEYDVYGLQFHPESILSSDGEMMLKNFLNIK